MKVVPLDLRLEQAYESFLLHHELALLYYSVAYRDCLRSLLGCRPDYVVALDGDDVVGTLPLMSLEGPFGRVINSLPYYGSNGGILAVDRNARDALWAHYRALLAERDVAAATLIEHPLAPCTPAADLYDMVEERIGQITPLDLGADREATLWSRIDSSTRRNIKRAQACGIAVRVANGDDAFDFLYETHRDNIAAIGGRVKERAFFDLVRRYFVADRDFRIYLAERSGVPVAALLIFYYGRWVEYFTPAVVHTARGMQPSAAILFHALLDASVAGFEFWNWGGTWLNQDGVYRFKRKWGARDYRYRYFTRVKDPRLRRANREELLSGYPGFFTLPFGALNAA
jgi:hypothetical protein